jgi:hypothetical protein
MSYLLKVYAVALAVGIVAASVAGSALGDTVRAAVAAML